MCLKSRLKVASDSGCLCTDSPCTRPMSSSSASIGHAHGDRWATVGDPGTPHATLSSLDDGSTYVVVSEVNVDTDRLAALAADSRKCCSQESASRSPGCCCPSRFGLSARLEARADDGSPVLLGARRRHRRWHDLRSHRCRRSTRRRSRRRRSLRLSTRSPPSLLIVPVASRSSQVVDSHRRPRRGDRRRGRRHPASWRRSWTAAVAVVGTVPVVGRRRRRTRRQMTPSSSVGNRRRRRRSAARRALSPAPSPSIVAAPTGGLADRHRPAGIRPGRRHRRPRLGAEPRSRAGSAARDRRDAGVVPRTCRCRSLALAARPIGRRPLVARRRCQRRRLGRQHRAPRALPCRRTLVLLDPLVRVPAPGCWSPSASSSHTVPGCVVRRPRDDVAPPAPAVRTDVSPD